MTGKGSLQTLLSDVAEVVADDSVAAKGTWESVKADDDGKPVTYWRTKSPVAVVADAPASADDDVDALQVDSPTVCDERLETRSLLTYMACS